MGAAKRMYSLPLYKLLLLAITVVAVAACGGQGSTATPGPAATPTPSPTLEDMVDSTPVLEATVAEAVASRETSVPTVVEGPLAPELVGIQGWINTEPFTLASLRGQVVLVDIWTYTCVNCIRTIPYLKDWYDKYADRGLVIIGVHSPEFKFEEKRENVEAAVAKYEIKWPVVQDNDFATWDAYDNRYWPAKYLIDKNGVIQYSHFGEGAYDETEQKIRELLAEAGTSLSQIQAGSDPGPEADPKAYASQDTGQTRELYAGYRRNYGALSSSETPYIGNLDYYDAPASTPTLYEDPGEHRNHLLYLHGLWAKETESVVHARATQGLEDYIVLKFFGTSLNVVLDFQEGGPFQVVATLDGAPIPETHRGADIQVDGDGRTFLLVDNPRMYRVVELPKYGGYELRLASTSDRFGVFAFTFGSYAQGP